MFVYQRIKVYLHTLFFPIPIAVNTKLWIDNEGYQSCSHQEFEAMDGGDNLAITLKLFLLKLQAIAVSLSGKWRIKAFNLYSTLYQ